MITRIEISADNDRGLTSSIIEPKSGVNLFVGENGCGKSSLLKAMTQGSFVNIVTDGASPFGYFDSERDNPRVKTSNPLSSDSMMVSVKSHFESHGETLLPILEQMSNEENTVLFLDEPENGISMSNQLKLWRKINKAVKNGCQFFIATHSYILIEKFKEVYDLNNYEWVKSKEYLERFKI
tara:strand:- start:6111 stop:6653 length:543 start_codon:yes stop_codon:yes gene_type:complete